MRLSFDSFFVCQTEFILFENISQWFRVFKPYQGHTASRKSIFCSEQKSFVMGMQLKYLQISQSWIGVT